MSALYTYSTPFAKSGVALSFGSVPVLFHTVGRRFPCVKLMTVSWPYQMPGVCPVCYRRTRCSNLAHVGFYSSPPGVFIIISCLLKACQHVYICAIFRVTINSRIIFSQSKQILIYRFFQSSLLELCKLLFPHRRHQFNSCSIPFCMI